MPPPSSESERNRLVIRTLTRTPPLVAGLYRQVRAAATAAASRPRSGLMPRSTWTSCTVPFSSTRTRRKTVPLMRCRSASGGIRGFRSVDRLRRDDVVPHLDQVAFASPRAGRPPAARGSVRPRAGPGPASVAPRSAGPPPARASAPRGDRRGLSRNAALERAPGGGRLPRLLGGRNRRPHGRRGCRAAGRPRRRCAGQDLAARRSRIACVCLATSCCATSRAISTVSGAGVASAVAPGPGAWSA